MDFLIIFMCVTTDKCQQPQQQTLTNPISHSQVMSGFLRGRGNSFNIEIHKFISTTTIILFAGGDIHDIPCRDILVVQSTREL